MKEALRLKSYANRSPRIPVLQRGVIREGNQTIKVTSQLTDGNQIKRRIRKIKTKVRGREGKGYAELIPLTMV